jgi:hypothetical protein
MDTTVSMGVTSSIFILHTPLCKRLNSASGSSG